jgi:hypothetical protein
VRFARRAIRVDLRGEYGSYESSKAPCCGAGGVCGLAERPRVGVVGTRGSIVSAILANFNRLNPNGQLRARAASRARCEQ